MRLAFSIFPFLNQVGKGRKTVEIAQDNQFAVNPNFTLIENQRINLYKMLKCILCLLSLAVTSSTCYAQSLTSSISVAPLKMNVFYVGIYNPISIAVAGVEERYIYATIEVTGATEEYYANKPEIIRPRINRRIDTILELDERVGNLVATCEYSYNVIVDAPGVAEIKLYTLEYADDTLYLGSRKFRCKRMPSPVASFMGIRGEGTISRTKLKAAQGVRAQLMNFDINLQIKVQKFNLTLLSKAAEKDKITELYAESNRLTQEMKELLQTAKDSDRIIIDNIVVEYPPKSGIEEFLNAIYITVWGS